MSVNVSMKIRLRRLVNRLDQWFYYAKCALVTKYNVIKIRRLPPTWSDRDAVLYHFLFQLIEDFVEKEEPFGSDFSRDAMMRNIAYLLERDTMMQNIDQHNRSVEIIEIYHWIKNDFDKFDDKLRELYLQYSHSEFPFVSNSSDNDVISRIHFEEDRQDQEIEMMLGRIISIRRFLWT